MSHPIHLIKRYHQSVEDGKYSAIREQVLANAPFPTFDPQGRDSKYIEALERALSIAYAKCANLEASRARIIDKLNLVREIVATGVKADKGETLSDDDYLLILAGWAAEQRGRW